MRVHEGREVGCMRAGEKKVGNCRREGWGGGVRVHEGREVECVRTEKERVKNCLVV